MDFPTYSDAHINMLCWMKIVKNRDNLIIHKQVLKYTQGLHTTLLSGGTKNEDTNQETRASAQSGCLGARARSPTLVGVSLFVKSIWKEAPPCFIATRKLSHARWKLTRNGGILTCSSQWHNQPHTTIRQWRDFQTPVVLKIKATRASLKLCGATSTWERLSHRRWITHTHHNMNGKGRY